MINTRQLNDDAKKHIKYLENFDTRFYAKTGKRLSTEKLNTLGICLENFAKVAASNPAKYFTEDIQSMDVSFIKQYGLDIIYRTIATQLADEIASTQAIYSRDSQIRYIEYFYDKTTSEPEKLMVSPFTNGLGQNGTGITGGGISNATTDSTGALASHTLAANILEGHVVVTVGEDKFTDFGGKLYKAGTDGKVEYGTINYTTGAVTLSNMAHDAKVLFQYTTDNVTTPVTNAKKASMRIKSMPVRAKSVKIITVYSVEAVQELQMQYGVGIHNEFVDQVVQEIVATIDYDLMDHAKLAAGLGTNVVDYKLKLAGASVNAITMTQHYADFALKLSEAANLIYKKTRSIRANIAIVGPGVTPIIEALPNFTVATGTFSGTSTQGAYVLGNLGSLKVIVNPNYDMYDCILLYKDYNNPLLASLIYAPYLPVSKVFSTSAEKFENQIGLMTTYGIVVPSIHWFAKVNIDAS